MKVIIIYGSANDQPFMQPGRDYLDKQNVVYEERVLSAHRNLSELMDYLDELNKQAENYQQIWIHEIQPKLAKLSSRGRQIVVPDSTHGTIPREARATNSGSTDRDSCWRAVCTSQASGRPVAEQTAAWRRYP